ncbi:Stress-induced acidophilic repeat motif-containing protein [Duganella sp. CF517]|uniref:KGG domain-containing protein n=1 Tax=Duganella sp. CF517 TaxID=1881038 RepID=UPI0008B025CD|nr:KGG domain-containing protein [Duganella sp. CF517]SEN34662.1 Stress-induced acidophilic repeat motif-containing protein [Duganella sp. CF517]
MATNDKSGSGGGNQGGGRGGKQGGKSGNEQSEPRKRGFASMDPEQQRQIAAEGGRAAHEKGTAHEFTSEEARRAGAMSHKNDANSQSSTGASRGGSGGGNKASARVEDADEAGGGAGRGGSRSGSGGSGSKS